MLNGPAWYVNHPDLSVVLQPATNNTKAKKSVFPKVFMPASLRQHKTNFKQHSLPSAGARASARSNMGHGNKCQDNHPFHHPPPPPKFLSTSSFHPLHFQQRNPRLP
jgi:hypothetical protein